MAWPSHPRKFRRPCHNRIDGARARHNATLRTSTRYQPQLTRLVAATAITRFFSARQTPARQAASERTAKQTNSVAAPPADRFWRRLADLLSSECPAPAAVGRRSTRRPRRFGWGGPGYVTVPILSVLAAIGYVYYTTVFLAIPAWLGLTTAAGLANAAAFTALAAACVATYAVAVLRDPGRVPASFVPDVEDAGSPIHEIKRKGGDLRYCQKCSHYKPPRAHHCRVCKRCVLRMDHHCIWINNCVGHENYKIFLIFVLYAVIACLYSMVLIIGGAMHLPKDEQPGSDSPRTSIIVCGVLLCPLALALMVLLGWHVYLILHNKTTIEYHEGVRAMWLAEKAGNLYHHPYNLGAYENLISVLGPNMFCWLCPVSRNIGSGVRFRTSYDIPLAKAPM